MNIVLMTVTMTLFGKAIIQILAISDSKSGSFYQRSIKNCHLFSGHLIGEKNKYLCSSNEFFILDDRKI